MRGENAKFKRTFEPQQAQIQKGEQVSVSSWCAECAVLENEILSLSDTLQSSTSPQGRHESTSRYTDNMTETIFTKQMYVKNKCNRSARRK